MRNNLYRFLTILCLFTLGISTLFAVPAYRGWQQRTLSDGTTINLRLVGDEFYHFWETEDGKIAEEQPDGTFIVTKQSRPTEKQIKALRKASAMYKSQPRKAIGERTLAPKGLVILVQFANVSFNTSNDATAFNNMLNQEGYNYNGATGSAVDYFKAQSNNTYAPTFDVFGPVTLPENRVYYGEQGYSSYTGRTENDLYIADFVIDAVTAAENAGCDFSKYDSDNDGYVDIVYFFYAGKGQAAGGTAETIWPHNWELISALYYQETHGTSEYYYNRSTNQYNIPRFDGKYINNYVCSAELRSDGKRSGIGTLCHEFSHVIGMPDYYDTNYGANDENSVTPGKWSIMDQGSYNNKEMTPPNYSIFDKYYMGWATPKFLAKNEKKNVTLTTDYNDGYQITGGASRVAYTNTNTVYYIENRQKSGWDAYLPSSGMLVWKVKYSQSVWEDNAPNDTDGNPRYTLVPSGGGTMIGDVWDEYDQQIHDADDDPYPGQGNVTSYTPFTGCALTEITKSGSNITFKYNGGQAKWSYALLGENCTYPSDGEVNFNASLSLTITPDAGYTLADAACWEVTMGSTTLTYGTDFTYNSSTNTFYIPSVTGDVEMYIYGGRPVTWMANGSEFTTNMSIEDKITLPATNPSDCSGTGGKKFVGWCTNSSYSHATTAPTFAKTGDAYTVATYYAVYATAGSGGGSSATYEFSITTSDFSGSSYADNNGEHTSTAYDVTDNTNTLSVSWTSFNVANNTGMQWKKSGSYIYNSTDLGKINSVTVSGDALSQYYGTSEEPTNSTLSSSDGYFKVTNSTSGALHTTSITVNFTKTTGGTSYSDYSTTCAACTLTGITLNTSGATTTFTQGQTFTSEGLVVTASYSDCSDRTVSPTSVSSPDMSSTGSKTITVTYTEGEVTKTITYIITVNAAPIYTIRFFDGTTKLKEESLVAGATATPPSDPADCTDNGYTFVGWYTSKLADDNTTVTSGWITDFTVSAAQDYYAVYSHTETSGSGSSATYEFSITTGDFSGSSYSANDGAHTSTAYDVTDNTNTMSVSWTSSNVSNQSGTQWKKNGSYIYNDTDLGKINSVTITGDALTKYYGTASNPSNSTLGANDGYFKVTNETSGALHTTSITVNFTISSGGGTSTTYYVGTKDCTLPTEVTITFHKNDGTDATTSQTIDYNTPTNLTANSFSREGYTFQGWAMSASGEKVHNDQASVSLTKNTDLYAVWQKNNYNVSFTITPADKATATINSSATTPQSIDYGETVTLDITPNDAYVVSEVTATGVTLTGTGNSRTFTMPDNDVAISITLAAKPKYTVTWSANGTTTTEEYIEGASIVFPATATGCDGKVFIGWSAVTVDETDTKPALVTSATMGTSPLTYYAVFAESSTGSGANKFRRITADDDLVRASGTQIAIISNYAEKILQNDFTTVDAPTPDGDGLITVTDNQIWTLTEEDSYHYWTLLSGTVQLGVSATSGYSSSGDYYSCGNYSTAASYWYIEHGSSSEINGESDCFYLYNWASSSGWYDLLEYYGSSRYEWESVYFASVTSGFKTYGAMRIYVPAASYTGYTTSCTPCDYKVTLTKGEEENGTFTLNKSNGTYNNCTSDFVVTVSGITPAEHYTCSGVTATGGNNTVTGPDGSGNYTVTYTKDNNITSTITANFAPESKYTVTWSANGDDSNTAEYYEGEDIVFPSSASGCDGKVFRGWSAVQVPETDDEPTYVTSATMPNHDITYYAVYAEASSSGGSVTYSKATSIAAGDKVVFVCESAGMEMTSISNTSTKYGEGTAFTTTPAGTFIFDVEAGTSTGTFAFKNGGKYLYWGSGNSLNVYNTTATANNSWSVSINSSGNATILNASNTSRRIVWNSGSPRFACYDNPTIGSTYYAVQIYKQSGGVSYSGYTTACGASISAKNVGWITATKGQKVKRVINVSAKNFDAPTTLSASCANSHFNVSLAATAVPDGASGLETTLTVEYTPVDFGAKEENVDIVLTAGDKTRTIKVSGRSLPEEFIIIAKKYDKWYAVPADMNSGSNQYDGVEVSPNTEPPTFVSIAPSTIIYSLQTVASTRYNEAGNCVLLVGNDNKCLWANGSANGTGIYNNNIVSKATDGHYEWLLTTEDGAQYTISNPAHPDAAAGRRLANGGTGGTQFGLYKDATVFYIVPVGCSSQPQDVHVSAKRVDATFSWVSNASSITIDVYTNEAMTEGHLSAVATSSPFVFSGLSETTSYWYKLTPGTSTDCAVEGTFKTSGPIIDITEWKEDGVVLFIDKGDINPVIVIDGQEEHGSITGGGGTATELFFAKYFEGAGSMKLLSIFNGTNSAISLEKYKFYDRHAGGSASSYSSGDTEYDLAPLGSISAGQEIIFFSRPLSTEAELSGCSNDFLTEVAKKSEPTDNPRWIECADGKFAGRAITFNGNDAILLKKDGVLIDVIGALGKPGQGSNCKGEDAWEGTIANMDYGKKPSDPAFEAFFEASSKSPVTTEDSTVILNAFGINLADKEIDISTARCIFFRDNRVTSGDSAVNMNTGENFKTFTTHIEGGTTFKSEWYGRSVCMTLNAANKEAAGVTSDAQATCNSYQDIANMDYNEYYIDYTSHIEPGKTLDNFTSDPETKLYDIPIANLSNYTCLNIRFQLQKNDDTHEVLTEAAQQVPIIVSGAKSTDDDLFSKLVVDKESGNPSYSHSVERCKTCNVVVLANSTLTKADDASASDVPQVSNVKVYPTGKLHVPSGTSYTVKSLALRRQEDDVASAKIEGTLNVLTNDATYLDIRIDPTNWHYFTLPYDCNVSDIRFANEEETAIPQVGSDFLLCSYDGEHRAATKSTSWKDLTSTDVLKKGIGYIIAIPGDGKVQREFRFPMANTVLTEENDNKLIDDLHAWGGDDAELRPNHKGWNLIGNPYMMYYNLPTTTTPLAAGTLIHDPDEDPWMGHWVIEEGTGEDAGTGALYYIVVPQDNGWSEYLQTTIGGFDMPPFTSYFVQLGGNPDDNKGIEFVTTNKEDGPSPVIRRAPAEDIVDNHEVWFGVDLINADGESDETTLLMSDKFTNDYDMMRDLVKMRGTYYTYYTKPVLASRNNEGEMAFNALPDSTAAAGVPLSFFAAADGQYRFTVSAHYPLDEVKEAYIYDNDNADAKWHNLLQEDYVFNTKRGDNTSRFLLAVKVERKQPEITTSIDNLHKGLVLTTINRTLMLSGLTNDADIYVYDVSGKLLDARLHYSSESGIFRTTVNTAGLYFVRVKTPDGQQTLETVVY